MVHPSFQTGLWSDSSSFFDLDERLAPLAKVGHLNLPLAPRKIFMPDYAALNSTVFHCVGIGEQYIRERFLELFRSCEQRNETFLFADTGSNEGTWSLLAAAHGCRALAVDPQPLCITLLKAAANRSNLSAAIETHNRVLSPMSMHNPNGSMMVPNDQCLGTSEYHVHLNRVSDVTREGRTRLQRRARRLPITPVAFEDVVGPERVVSMWHLECVCCHSELSCHLHRLHPNLHHQLIANLQEATRTD